MVTVQFQDGARAAHVVAELRNLNQGRIDTWVKASDVEAYTHSGESHNERQLFDKAFFFPSNKGNGTVEFTLRIRSTEKNQWYLLSAYNGKLVQMLMYHFHDDIEKISMDMRKGEDL